MGTTAAAAIGLALASAGRLAVAIAILTGFFLLGAYLWWTSEGSRWGQLGGSILGGVTLALIVGAFQSELSRRDQQRDAERSFRLTLSLQHDLSGIDLHGRLLSGFYLARKELSLADLCRAKLDGANFFGARLRDADLVGAHLERAVLSESDLREADFEGAHMARTDLLTARLTGASLRDADLRNASLVGANLRRACLAGAHLEGADLTGANLSDAVLTRAHLEGAILESDLRPANLTGTGLVDATYDGRTRWPRGFAPSAAVAGRPVVGGPAPTRVPRPTIVGATPDSVVRIVDADTLVLRGSGSARLIGVDAPALGEPFGAAATAYAQRMLPAGRRIRFGFDRERRDKFGRALIYVVLPNGRLFNQMLTAEGFAAPVDEGPNRLHRPEIDRAASRARQQGRRIWRRCPA